MDKKEIRRLFYRDGYRLAHKHLDPGLTAQNLMTAVARLYQSIDDLLASFVERTSSDGQPAACKKGCAWCCHQEVFAVSHEFLYLQEYMKISLSDKQREEVLERAREKGLHSLNLTLEEQLKLRIACPFLEEGACMVYQARPMACRIYLSSNLASCRREHDLPSDSRRMPELFEFPLLAGRMLNEGFVAYLKQSGIASSELPLEQGYSSMVTMGQSMEDWLNGKESSA